MRLINLFLIFLVLTIPKTYSAYPSHWWQPVSREGAPLWEILPQEAKPGEVILSKRNELGILSNFAATPFVFDHKRYASMEGFWQMMKYPENDQDLRAKHPGARWNYTRQQVSQMTAFEAKKAGSAASKIMKAMEINWVTYQGKLMTYRTNEKGDHYQLIRQAMLEKLKQNSDVKKILLKTGDLILKPDHHETEFFPAWQYGQIWMEIRSNLRASLTP